MANPNTERDERVRQLISELSNVEFEARGLARSRYHDRLFAAGRPRPANEQFDEGWSAAKNFYATAMRDLCVEKVKSMADEWQILWDKDLTGDHSEKIVYVQSANQIILALESLTLEGEQKR